MATIAEAYQLATAHHRAGQLREAERIYRQILAAQPNHAEAMHHLGLLAHAAGASDAAVEMVGRSIQIAPGVGYFYRNFGEVLRGAGEFEKALEAYRKSIQLSGEDGSIRQGIGRCLEEMDRVQEAIGEYQRAIELRPDLAMAHFNLGVAVEKLGRFREAIGHFEKAIALRPDYALARTARATGLLRLGEFEEGLKEYEARWGLEWMKDRRPVAGKAVWDGSELDGKTILVRGEQGMGDVIHAARYLKVVAQRGGRVLVEVHGPLVRLMRSVEGVSEAVAIGQALPEFDVQVGMMSLPGILGTRMEAIGAEIPYVRTNEAAREEGQLRVGVCWAGSANPLARHRAVPAELIGKLVEVNGVEFWSLQKERAGALPMAMIDPMADVKGFSDTAEVIAKLDLVISVDTAVAHLAGAMGKKTWVLLASVADWRWFVDREDSAWYPTMKLYRQKVRGEWGEVIQRVARDLQDESAR
jgi:Flp pilus assembly protein TadD